MRVATLPALSTVLVGVILSFGGCSSVEHAAGGTVSGTGAGLSTGSGGGGGGSAGGSPRRCPGVYKDITYGECDIALQDCPWGLGCRPVGGPSGTTTGCIPGPGLLGAGSACATDDDCQPSLLCVGGFCASLCCPVTGEPCPDKKCDVEVFMTTTTVFYVCQANLQCAFFSKNACPSGYDCYLPALTTDVGECIMPTVDAGGDGHACQFLNDCLDMQECYAGTCRFLCELGGPPGALPGEGGCPQFQACMDFGATTSIGICQP